MLQKRYYIISFVLISLILFYFWTVISSSGPYLRDDIKQYVYNHNDNTKEYYNNLTNNILNGHLYLNIAVPKELEELKNPYDPSERALNNVKFLYDGTLYNHH